MAAGCCGIAPVGIAAYLVAGFAIAALAGLLAPRWLCLAAGWLFLFLGAGVPAIAWTVAAHTRGDTSGYGMLGTICLILFLVPGVCLTAIGLLKER